MGGPRSAIIWFFLERPVDGLSLGQIGERLALSGGTLAQRFAAAEGTPAHQSQLSHIIGIERWGQRRLCVPLGEPFLQDDYDGYRPAAGQSWPDLVAAFIATRTDTVALTGQLASAGVSPATLVPHNQIGNISVRAWLQYLNQHANIEGKRVR